ncbi:hypothetical protein [Sungkyunkwania multivorans]
MLISCNPSKKLESNADDLAFVENFAQEFYLEDGFDHDKLNKYYIEHIEAFDKLDEKRKKFHREYIEEIIAKVNEELKACSFEYEILAHNEVTEEEASEYGLIYGNYSDVYYLKCKGEKIFTFFILDNAEHGRFMKSFCLDIYNSKKGKVKPYLIEEFYKIGESP